MSTRLMDLTSEERTAILFADLLIGAVGDTTDLGPDRDEALGRLKAKFVPGLFRSPDFLENKMSITKIMFKTLGDVELVGDAVTFWLNYTANGEYVRMLRVYTTDAGAIGFLYNPKDLEGPEYIYALPTIGDNKDLALLKAVVAELNGRKPMANSNGKTKWSKVEALIRLLTEASYDPEDGFDPDIDQADARAILAKAIADVGGTTNE